MKKRINSGLLSPLFIVVIIIGIGSFTQSCTGSKDKKENTQWYSSLEWLNGLQLRPHSSTNQLEFEKLYKASPVWWDKAFEWLKTNDLNTIEPDTYTIEEGSVRAIVSEAPAPALEKVRWEAHKNYSDIQYIIKGKTKMGVAPVSEATVTEAYDSTNDIGFFDVEGELFTAEPGTFFIFTPEDAHRPGIQVEGYDTVKKVVIKVRVKNNR